MNHTSSPPLFDNKSLNINQNNHLNPVNLITLHNPYIHLPNIKPLHSREEHFSPSTSVADSNLRRTRKNNKKTKLNLAAQIQQDPTLPNNQSPTNSTRGKPIPQKKQKKPIWSWLEQLLSQELPEPFFPWTSPTKRYCRGKLRLRFFFRVPSYLTCKYVYI